MEELEVKEAIVKDIKSFGGKKQQPIRTTDVILDTGKRGTGKSYLLQWFIKKHIHKVVKSVIWDPLAQYEELGRVYRKVSEIPEEEWEDKNVSLVFQPEEDTEETFERLNREIYRRGNIHYAVEEFSNYTTPYQIPKWFNKIVLRGRNRGIGIWGVSQRPALIHLNFFAVIDRWFVFAQDLKRDVARVNDYLEAVEGKDYTQIIRKLPDRHFISFYRERGSGRTEINFHSPVKG